MRENGQFLGFAPRWQLPTKIRNISDPATNTSNILIIHDSAAEADQGLAPHFSGEVLGDSEIIISSYALRHLGVPADRKHKVEIYFDLLGLLDLFATVTGTSARKDDKNPNADANAALREILPTTEQMIGILRDVY